jgi:hypothetical protein
VALRQRIGLLRAASVGVDGSKFKGINARDKNFTRAKVKKRLRQMEESLKRRRLQLDAARRQPSTPKVRIDHLEKKIKNLKQDMEFLRRLGARLASGGAEKQISLADPDARSLVTSGAGAGTVGYNVQCVVDARRHLIIAHEVTNASNDSSLLFAMAKLAQKTLGVRAIEAVVDRGYYKGEEILACEQAGVRLYIPRRQTSGAKAKGRFGKQDFVHVPGADIYICPGGKRLTYRCANMEDGKRLHHYWTTACSSCRWKEKCTTGEERRLKRWEREDVLDAVQNRLDGSPGAMTLRRSVVEHPFGTIKFWMVAVHFLMKRLPNVRTEMALHVLSYNLKRVMNILSVDGLMKTIRA